MKSTILISVMALAAALVIATGPAGAKPASPFKGDVLGSFFFHACPAGTPTAAVCLHDDVTGNLTHLGRITGSFEVVFERDPFGADPCVPVQKQGSFTVANGDRLDVEAEGTFCSATVTATYEYQVTGGSGRFAGSSGSGSWLVPPPATFDGVAGTGDEFLNGVLLK